MRAKWRWSTALVVALVWLGLYPQPVVDTAARQSSPVSRRQLSSRRGEPDERPARSTLLGPLVAVAATVLVVLIAAISIHRSHRLMAALTLAGLAIALLTLLRPAHRQPPRSATALLALDDYARFYIGLILAATAAVTLLSFGYLERRHEQRDEYYLLLLLAALGSIVLVPPSTSPRSFLASSC